MEYGEAKKSYTYSLLVTNRLQANGISKNSCFRPVSVKSIRFCWFLWFLTLNYRPALDVRVGKACQVTFSKGSP